MNVVIATKTAKNLFASFTKKYTLPKFIIVFNTLTDIIAPAIEKSDSHPHRIVLLKIGFGYKRIYDAIK